MPNNRLYSWENYIDCFTRASIDWVSTHSLITEFATNNSLGKKTVIHCVAELDIRTIPGWRVSRCVMCAVRCVGEGQAQWHTERAVVYTSTLRHHSTRAPKRLVWQPRVGGTLDTYFVTVWGTVYSPVDVALRVINVLHQNWEIESVLWEFGRLDILVLLLLTGCTEYSLWPNSSEYE